MNNRTTTFISIVPMLLLAGCTTIPAVQNYHYLSWKQRLAELTTIDKWSADGVLGAQYRNENNIVSYNWQQNADAYSIKIHSPLNLVSVAVDGNKNQVALTKSNHETFRATSPEKLVQEQLGLRLPISSLAYWIKGLPAPHAAYKGKFDGYNHLINLQQQGWTLAYANFQVINGIDLPQKINLQNKQLKIKIVIKDWKIW